MNHNHMVFLPGIQNWINVVLDFFGLFLYFVYFLKLYFIYLEAIKHDKELAVYKKYFKHVSKMCITQ